MFLVLCVRYGKRYEVSLLSVTYFKKSTFFLTGTFKKGRERLKQTARRGMLRQGKCMLFAENQLPWKMCCLSPSSERNNRLIEVVSLLGQKRLSFCFRSN